MAKVKSHLRSWILEHALTLKDKRFNQADLAREIEVSEATVSRLANNRIHRVDAVTLMKICKFFGKRDLGDLLYIDWDAPDEPEKTGGDNTEAK